MQASIDQASHPSIASLDVRHSIDQICQYVLHRDSLDFILKTSCSPRRSLDARHSIEQICPSVHRDSLGFIPNIHHSTRVRNPTEHASLSNESMERARGAPIRNTVYRLRCGVKDTDTHGAKNNAQTQCRRERTPGDKQGVVRGDKDGNESTWPNGGGETNETAIPGGGRPGGEAPD